MKIGICKELFKMSEPIIQYHNIHKSFDKIDVLNGINLHIQPSERIALIGPSGSGKTTLIRLLMTLEQPTMGTIIVNGENLWQMEKNNKLVPANEKHLQKIRGQIGMVFQHFNLFPHLTALENCMVALIQVQKKSKKTAKMIAVQMLERVGLKNHMNSYPNQLSGGQQQRVAIARALIMKPKVMLFDEVTSALDPELVDEVLQVIRDLAKTEDMAMLLVTHEMEFALDIADRIIFLDGGVIAEQGTPEEVLEQSNNKRLQAFLHRFRNAKA